MPGAVCVGCGDDERPALVFLGGSSGLSASFFVPFLAVDIAFAFALALGAGADELLDAPVSGGGSCTGFNGNAGVGGNACRRGGVSNLGSLSFCGVEVGVVVCFPFCFILRFASR